MIQTKKRKTTEETTDKLQHIFDALRTRRLYMSNTAHLRDAIWKQHLGMISTFEFEKNPTEARQKENDLLEAGNRYFENGYRLRNTQRRQFGLSHPVPDEAIAWELVQRGYIGTCETWQLEYIVKI